MARQARGITQNKLFHVFNRSCHGAILFHSKLDYEYFIELLFTKAVKHKVVIHHYCIMPTHFHLMLTPLEEKSLPDFMHDVGSIYAVHHNKHHGTRGHAFEDRYKSKEVLSEEYRKTLIEYIEENPVKAKLVKRSKDWKYSSKGRGALNETELLSEYNRKIEVLGIMSRKEMERMSKERLDELCSEIPHKYREKMIIGRLRSG